MNRIYFDTRGPVKAWTVSASALALACAFGTRNLQAAEPDEAPAPAEAPAPPGEAPAPAPAAPPAGEAPPPGGVRAPELLETKAADYPEAERGEGRAASVGLRLTIAVDGSVSQAEVVESAGAAFDEAARSAALSFRFKPAERDGTPISVRILYRTEFTPPDEPVAAAVIAPVGVTPAVAAPTPPAAAPRDAPAEEGEVRVRGFQSETEKLEKSSDAVTVVDLEEARKRSSDMGEILARTPGVVVRRAGGLGSDTRFSLNGLYGRSVPTFVDSVPLWMSGFPENIASIQVNLIHHVEIYRGVVPLRLSADALGGAVNFVTDKVYENHLSASYQTGSFGLHRVSGLAQFRHEPSGFVARLSGYGDVARNDYWIDVEVPDERGRLSPATVQRFHDKYAALGLMAEVGFVDRPWAKRFLIKGFASSSDKDLQNNTVMSVPYGEVVYGDQSIGGNLLYEQDLSDNLELQLLTTYSHRNFDFLDVSEWVYDWYGERVRERRVPGEIQGKPMDQSIWRDAVFGRAQLEWNFTPAQALALTTTPLFSTQTGDERRQLDPEARDPLSARQNMFKVVSAASHEWNAIPLASAPVHPGERRRGTDYALQNTFYIKNYFYRADAQEPLPGDVFRQRHTDSLTFGIGDGLRYGFTDWFFLKGSFEHATRLPDPFETFGDGALTLANLDLEPEVSNNGNLGPLIDLKKSATGDWVMTVNGSVRDSDRMIVLLGNDRSYTYQNVYRALTLGLEGGVSWTAPQRWIAIDTSATYTDSRNMSDEGTFAEFKGDRIPNRPYLTGSWAVRFLAEQLFFERDQLEPFYQGRYVHEFFRGWESQGLVQYKQVVPSQVSQDVGITYSYKADSYRLATTIECQNFTNERLYDDFGLQRPGRAFFWKLTGDLF